MRKSMRAIYCILSCQFIFFIGCNNNQESPPKLNVSYKPPLLPIRLVVNTDGNVYAEAEGSIVTPIGEFSIGAELPINEKNSRIMIVRDTQKGTFTATRINLPDEQATGIENPAVVIDVPKSKPKNVQINSFGEIAMEDLNTRSTQSHTIQEDSHLRRLTFTGNWLIDQGVIPSQGINGPNQLDRQSQIKLMQEMARKNRALENHRFP